MSIEDTLKLNFLLKMDWIWQIFKRYVRKELGRRGVEDPSDEELEAAFIEVLSASTVTVLVQEPWQNSVRFKGLDRGAVPERMDLNNDPMHYLFTHYGGGKFKLNFHQGWHFVATQNFKPEGPPRWHDLPDIGY
jgi:hypothetical protein